MHKPASTLRQPQNAPLSAAKSHRRRLALIGAGAIALLLLLAWIDGGEEPLHTIVQPVDLQSGAAS
jgi:hypothetical protein